MNDKTVIINVLRWRLDDIPFSFQTGHHYSRAHGFYIFWMFLCYSHTRPNNVDDVKMTNKEDTTRRQSDKFQFSTSISRRFIPFYSSEIGSCFPPFNSNNREFKKLRRQLQRKRLIKIELCVQLSLLGLFYVDHVVQNRRTALSLAWYEWFSCKGKGWKIYYCELALSSEP